MPDTEQVIATLEGENKNIDTEISSLQFKKSANEVAIAQLKGVLQTQATALEAKYNDQITLLQKTVSDSNTLIAEKDNTIATLTAENEALKSAQIEPLPEEIKP